MIILQIFVNKFEVIHLTTKHIYTCAVSENLKLQLNKNADIFTFCCDHDILTLQVALTTMTLDDLRSTT